MGKSHLRRQVLSQGGSLGKAYDAHNEYKRESDLRSLTSDETEDYMKLKKDNVILQARQSKELNDLRRAFSKQEHELKLLPGGTNAIPAKNFDFRKIIVDQSKKQVGTLESARKLTL